MTSLLFLGDAGQYPGSMTTWWLGWLATHKKNRKIFKAVGTKALGWLKRHGHWCLLLRLDACGRRWSLSAGWLAAPLLLALPHLDRARQIASLCPGVSAGQSDLLALLSLTRYREQTHSIKHAAGLLLPVLAAPTLVSEQVSRRASSAFPTRCTSWTTV